MQSTDFEAERGFVIYDVTFTATGASGRRKSATFQLFFDIPMPQIEGCELQNVNHQVQKAYYKCSVRFTYNSVYGPTDLDGRLAAKQHSQRFFDHNFDSCFFLYPS